MIVDREGRRQPAAKVAIEYAPELAFGKTLRNFVSRRTPARDDFDFEVRNVVPGANVRVFAEHEGRRSATVPVVLKAGEQSDVVLILE